MTNINVCLACDDNYSKYSGVVMASILDNTNSDDKLSFYILDGGVSDIRKQQILSLNSIKECDINFVPINPGQTIINEVCKDRIKLVGDTWNVQSSNFINRSSYVSEPKVIHYVAKNKPWGLNSYSYHKNLYFKYLQLTPWKLSDVELKKALKSTAFNYFKYRPMFLFRPRFYEALIKTYVIEEQN